MRDLVQIGLRKKIVLIVSLCVPQKKTITEENRNDRDDV